MPMPFYMYYYIHSGILFIYMQMFYYCIIYNALCTVFINIQVSTFTVARKTFNLETSLSVSGNSRGGTASFMPGR